MGGFPGDLGHKRINLNPGDLYFGEGNIVIQTLLGSCVAITVWHPTLKIGGMCHYLLPDRSHYTKNIHHPRGYYCSDVMQYFAEVFEQRKLKPSAFQVKIFGGGQVLTSHERENLEINVAEANISYGRNHLIASGLKINAEDVGGRRYRKVYFEVTNGNVWVQYGKYTK